MGGFKGLKLERYKNLNKEQRRWIKLLAGAILVVALSLAALFLSNSILSTRNVYSGISIDGRDVGGMSPESLKSFLSKQYGSYLKDISVTFFSNDYEKTVSLSDLGIAVDTDSMSGKALGIGRKGFFLSRILEVSKLKKNPVSVPVELKIDQEQLDTVIEDVNRFFSKDVTVPNVIISGDKATLCTGVSGWIVDKDQLRLKVMELTNSRQNVYVHIPLKEIVPPKIDIDTVYKSIIQESQNAAIVKDEKGSAVIKPQVNGRSIDKTELSGIINRVESKEFKGYEEIALPVKITEPEVKTRDLEALLFRDVLASASTSFTTDTENNTNRGVNIRLAAKTINGRVIFPGEEFSFNDTTGPRTSDKGYVVAHIFTEGEISNGVGGGICQVSTTLYDAALLANLNISERHNHSFAVGYVSPGLDATVSYGYSDLKFKNTTDYPIRIDADVSGNNILTFKVVGTNLYSNVKVKTVTKTVSTTRATTEYTDDPNLPAGTEVVDRYGIDGIVVDTYVEIYSGKDLIKNYKIHTDTYTMLPKKVRRGVKKAG